LVRVSIIFVLSSLISIYAEAGSASKDCDHDSKNFRCVKYIKNYDADTITVNIPGAHPLFGKNISIRVNGIDTPELRTKNSCEKKAGYKAKYFVEKILKKGKRIDLQNISRGKYFRVVADVIVDGKNLSEYLIKNKMAYVYHGKTKEKIDWCNFKRVPSSK
jgi:micrococcal nuclease